MKKKTKAKQERLVQIKNPKTGNYTKIDKLRGSIVGHKKGGKPYKGIPIKRNKRKWD